MDIKIITIDIFQTLVDINSQKFHVWRTILEDKYSEEMAIKSWEQTLSILGKKMDSINKGNERFKSLMQLFKECYLYMAKNGKTISLSEVDRYINILINAHKNSALFEDAPAILDYFREKRYKIFIASDADREMLPNCLDYAQFDELYLSEGISLYKCDLQNRFFKTIISNSGIDSSSIIHIGDGEGEIVSAASSGIKTIWINRNNVNWGNKKIFPTYEVKNLSDINNYL